MKLFDRWIQSIRDAREARQFTAMGLYHRAFNNMARGELTAEGFLGPDTRSLARIQAEDAAEFRHLGLDWDEVAARLEELLARGADGLGEPITVGPYLVRVAETRGMFPCPWEDGMFRKRSATVHRLENGEPIEPGLLFGDLSLHLLKDHHFLQGRGGTFRIEPKLLKTVLGM